MSTVMPPWVIPSTWVWDRIGHVADVVGGGTPRTSESANFRDGQVPWITPADLSGYKNKYIARGARNITERGLQNSAARLLPTGTVLFSSRAPIGYVAIARNPLATNQGFKSFILPSSLDPGYVYYYLQRARGLALRLASGTTFPEVSGRQAAKLPLAIAPMPEQLRIVEAVESYFTRLDNAVATLERVQRNLKRYRASVLKAAVEGRLVPTEAELARAEGRDYEPASVLLERILAERRRRWEEAELAKMQAKGKTPKNDKWKTKYKEPDEPDTSGMQPLPEGWCWVNLSLIKEFSLYGPRFSSDAYTESGQLVLRTSDISESGKVNLDTAPRITLNDDDFQKYRVDMGDLLFTRTGSLGTLAVFNDQVDAIPGAYLIQFRLAAPEEVAWFCFYVFKSPNGQGHLARSGAGIGRPNLNAPTIESFVFGMPPLAEQSRILTELHRLLSITDGSSAETQKGERRCQRLRQSILKWAFEGKLVDQDSDDEPASLLIERTRAKREAHMSKKSRPRGGRAMAKKESKKSRPGLSETLAAAGCPLTPEELLEQGGFSTETIGEFYDELRTAVAEGRIKELRPTEKTALLEVEKS